MRTAIRFYEQGDDTQAMDRFMDILTNGDPSERSMANEYINLITHRMNGGTAAPAPAPSRAPSEDLPSAPIRPPSRGAAVAEATVVAEEAPARRAAPRVEASEEPAEAPAPVVRPEPRVRRAGEMSAADRAVMRKEIKTRLRAAQDRSLARLKAVEGVRVAMRDNGDPAAIGVPSDLLFQSGISFRRDAGKVLDPLTMLVFALGSTQVLILPEGAGVGDAKISDMRRTMGVSSALYQAGVAPPRVRVNLLSAQVDVPKPLSDFKGIVILFQYDQPMPLAVESAVGDDQGPPLSLGVFPQQIRPSRNEGGIVEFSVSDPPAGLSSWKFQLLQPSKDGSDSVPLQEVVGGGAVFHQIFWNGRQGYFGTPLPAGRYECVLSAVDGKNRRRTLHKWIQVAGDDAVAPKASAAPVKAAAAVETKEVSAPVKPASVEISRPKPAVRAKRPAVKRPSRAKSAKKKPAEPGAETPAQPGHYELSFKKDTHQMTASAEKALAKAASGLGNKPVEAVRVIGRFMADESDGAALGNRRAKVVAGLLLNRYHVDPDKIQMSSEAGQRAAVELVLSGKD